MTCDELLAAALEESERRHRDQGHELVYHLSFSSCTFIACQTRRHLISFLEKKSVTENNTRNP